MTSQLFLAPSFAPFLSVFFSYNSLRRMSLNINCFDMTLSLSASMQLMNVSLMGFFSP